MIFEGITLGLKRMSQTKETGEESILKMGKRLSRPEIRVAMETMFDFLEGMGEVFLRNRGNNK